MSKKTLIQRLADMEGTPKSHATSHIDNVLRAIRDDLRQHGGPLILPGFGRFSVKHVAERTYRNPKDGSRIVKPAHDAIVFKPESGLLEG